MGGGAPSPRGGGGGGTSSSEGASIPRFETKILNNNISIPTIGDSIYLLHWPSSSAWILHANNIDLLVTNTVN